MVRNIVAVVVLLLLAVGVFFVFRETPNEEQQAAKAVLKPVPFDQLDKVEVVRHEGTGDTLREERIVLDKSSGGWRMVQPVDYAVNSTSMERMEQALAGLRVVDVIAENKKKHHVLEVDDELGIEVKAFGGGQVLAHFIVGVTRYNMTYVRMPGSDTVYRIKGSHRPTFNKSAKNLRDKTVLKLDKGSVSKIAFSNAEGELALERTATGDDEQWAPLGVEIANFNVRKATSLARSLTGLSTRAFVDEDPGPAVTGLGPDAPQLKFNAKKDDKDGEYTITIGSEVEKDRQTYLKTSVSEQIFLVSSHMVKRFIGKADDFARTDDEVVKQTEQLKKAAEHKAQHEAGAGGMPPPGFGGQPGGGQIPPEIMKQLQAQMAKQPPPEKAPPHDEH